MSVTKIDDSLLHTENRFHCCLDDVPGLSATEMKEFMDYVPRNVIIPKVNEIVESLEGKAESADCYSKTETDTLLSEKADSVSVYDKTETDALFLQKADADSVFTKTEADTRFAGALMGSSEGESVEITDLSPFTHSVKAKLSAINLIPAPEAGTFTQNGITVVCGEDGSYTLTGTAAETADLRLVINENNPVITEAGNYFLTGAPEGSTKTTYWFAVHNAISGYDIYFAEAGSGVSLTFTKQETLYFTIRVAKGTSVDGAVFRPMLVKGTQEREFCKNITDFENMTVGGSIVRSGETQTLELVSDKDGELGTFDSGESLSLTAQEGGVDICVEYIRDINKAFAEICQSIALMKGE